MAADPWREQSLTPTWHILLVEDEEGVRQTLAENLPTAGPYEVVTAASAKAALRAFNEREPDLLLVDLGLPDVSGLELLRIIRNRCTVPIIVLTARNDEATRVLALEMGADDYLAKPFSFLELVARVKAVLRRTTQPVAARLAFDGLELDLPAREVILDGTLVPTTAKEFDLLVFMAMSPRQVFTSGQLLGQVWGVEPGWQSPATVKEHIHRLRAKLESSPTARRHLISVHRLGYRFDP